MATIADVPTIHREGEFAFRFHSADADEPPHVHVYGHGGKAKFWLPHRGEVTSRGYNRYELGRLASIVDAHTEEFLERWHEFFG